MTTTVDLLAVLGVHLAAFELPAMASVQVVGGMTARQVTVQLLCSEPSTIAQDLLSWADTLAEITAEAWRVPRTGSVHLSVTGLLPGGATVRVYGALPVTDCGLAGGLEPDATTTLPLAALRHLASPALVTEGVTL
jgi:hypothetical protein